MDYLTKIKKYMEENQIEAETLEWEKRVGTVAEAKEMIGEQAELLVKSVVFHKNDDIIVAIVRKDDRVSRKKLAEAAGVTKLKLCSAEETLEKTGYPAGGVPPFGFKAKFFIDKRVTELEEVIAGGGTSNTLLKIKTAELLKANKGEIVDIKENGH